MRLLITTVTLWALASAKPEIYKEKEDFQFSRSSSDDGSKSGYYGSQRGNMGGNYEKAHNMDSLAQHQMSTLVRQVDGELGEASNTRTGSVFTSGNSRGIYGSGNYDLSNLQGRNFQESGASYDDLYSSSSLSQNSRNHANLYSGINNSKYSSNPLEPSELSTGYQHDSLASQYVQAQNNQQAESRYHGSSSNYHYGGLGANQYKYYSQGNSQAKNGMDQSSNLQSNNDYYANTQSRLISTTPHRIYLRPGTRVSIPIAAQTFDASSLSRQQSAINTDAEVLGSDRHYVIKPVTAPKHYESSYSYHKEWEKHDALPISIVPTENPFPKHSELYEDAQKSGASGYQYQSELDSTNVLSSNLNSAQLNNLNSAQSRSINSAQSSSLNSAQSNSLNSAHLSSINRAQLNSLNNAHSSTLNSASGYSANTNSVAASNRLRYLSKTQNSAGLASSADVNQGNMQSLEASNLNKNLNLVDSNSQPKSYQSSYSYHKSWERRGDPYIIKPAASDISSQMSQKLISNSASYGSQSNSKYGSHYSQSQDDCVEPLRHKRSYNTHQFQQSQDEKHQHLELTELGQQTNNKWENLENLGQQPQDKWNDIQKVYQNSHSQEQLGQEIQSSWDLESFNQQQNQIGKLENLGQQTQNSWGDLEIFDQDKNHNEKLEDLGQQSQNTWGNLESFGQQENQMGQLEDLGQQSQNTWGNLESFGQQENQMGQLEDLGQQSQNTWGNLESFGQQENQMGQLEDLGQQTQNSGDLEDLGQQTQNSGDLEPLAQHHNKVEKLEDLGQESRNEWGHYNQKSQNPIGKPEDLSQNNQHEIRKLDLGQQTQNTWDASEKLNQQFLTEAGKLEDFGQQTQNKADDLENLEHQSQIQLGQSDLGQQTQGVWEHVGTLSQQNQNQVGKLEDLGQQVQNSRGLHNFQPQSPSQIGNFGQETQNIWDHIDNLGHQDQSQIGKLEDLGQEKQNVGIFGQETQNNWEHIDKFSQQDQSQIGNIENLGQEIQTSWDSDSFKHQFQSNNEHKGILGQETQKLSDNLVPQTESKPYDQQIQNGWNPVPVNSPLAPHITRNMGKTSQENIEKRNLSTSTQEDVNFWNNNYAFELQKHHNEDTNINQQTQHFYWPEQSQSNKQDFQQQSFDKWQHNLQSPNKEQSIPQESENNKDSLLWDMIDKLIEESEKKEKNESVVYNNDHSSNSYNTQNEHITTEKSTTEAIQSHVSNENNLDKINIENIGRGDIGPEDIQELSQDDHEKSDISKESFNKKSADLNVIGLENQKIVSTITTKPKQQHAINYLNTQSFPKELVNHSEPKNEHLDDYESTQGHEKTPQQELEQQHEFLEQSNINDKTLLDFSQQAQKPTNEDVKVLSQTNYNQLDIQSHSPHEYQSAKKIESLETKPLEITTVKPGFWKSVWGTTVNTKDKLITWFKN